MAEWEFPLKLFVNPKMAEYLKANDFWSEENMAVSVYVEVPKPELPTLPKFLQEQENDSDR